jgi:hypothetical protein
MYHTQYCILVPIDAVCRVGPNLGAMWYARICLPSTLRHDTTARWSTREVTCTVVCCSCTACTTYLRTCTYTGTAIHYTLHGTCVLLPCTYYLPVHGATAYTENGGMVHLSVQRIYTYTCQLPHEVVCTDTPQDVIPAGDAIQHPVHIPPTGCTTGCM